MTNIQKLAVPGRLAECGFFRLDFRPSTREVEDAVAAAAEEFAGDGPEARLTATRKAQKHLVDNLRVPKDRARKLLDPLRPEAGATTPLPIYTDVEVHELPDPEWLVEELFLSKSLVALYGPTGEGKTFIGLDLSFSIGTGLPFHQREVSKGNVVYVYAEGAPSLKFRVDAWKLAHPWEPKEEGNVWFIPTSVDLAGEEDDGLESLLTTIQARVPEPISLVVIDTLARCFGAADEDATQAMNHFTNRCAAIKEEFSSTVMVVHHTGWDPKRERGNKSLRNNFDTLIRCSMSGHSKVELKCQKQKDAPPFDPVQLRLDEVQLRDDQTSCVLRSVGSEDVTGAGLNDYAIEMLETLADLGHEGATYQQWLEATPDRISESTFKRRRGELAAQGFVTAPPEDADSSRGFRYELTAKGQGVLDQRRAQNGVNPNSDSDEAPSQSGSVSVPVELIDNPEDALGLNWGPDGSMNPSAHSGSGGGAYRAPPEPEAPVS